jgi:muconolactone delta-isomerase
MIILAIETPRPGVAAERFTQTLLREEAARAWELHQSGDIRELYFRMDKNAAVLVLESPSLDHARALLATLPLVREGLIGFELIPLRAYPGFERLFAGGAG